MEIKATGQKLPSIEYTYGLTGTVAAWVKNGKQLLPGGADQFSLPFTMDTLNKLGILTN